MPRFIQPNLLYQTCSFYMKQKTMWDSKLQTTELENYCDEALPAG